MSVGIPYWLIGGVLILRVLVALARVTVRVIIEGVMLLLWAVTTIFSLGVRTGRALVARRDGLSA